MTLTDTQIGTLVTVLVILVTAIANYLNHLSTVAKVDALHATLAAVSQAVNATPVAPPTVVLVDGHVIPPNAFTASLIQPTTSNAGSVSAAGTVKRPGDPT